MTKTMKPVEIKGVLIEPCGIEICMMARTRSSAVAVLIEPCGIEMQKVRNDFLEKLHAF